MLSLVQCRNKAQELGYDSMTFDLCGSKGKRKAQWVDAFMGVFMVEGELGVFFEREYRHLDMWCDNLKVPIKSAPVYVAVEDCGRTIEYNKRVVDL